MWEEFVFETRNDGAVWEWVRNTGRIRKDLRQPWVFVWIAETFSDVRRRWNTVETRGVV